MRHGRRLPSTLSMPLLALCALVIAATVACLLLLR